MSRRRSHASLGSLALFCILASATEARASGFQGPHGEWSAGGSVAVGFHPDLGTGVVYGADVAYTDEPVWAGGGVRMFDAGDSARVVYPYVEAGYWHYVNLGLGYSHAVTPDGDMSPGVHLFVGLPIPLSDSGFYVDPYYRPFFALDDRLQEAGVLLKWTPWLHDG